MTKRRTRKQKESAKHQFKTFRIKTGEDSFKRLKFKPSVKRQNKTPEKISSLKAKNKKVAKDKAKASNLASVKADIANSLVQGGIILGLELMLYFVLKF